MKKLFLLGVLLSALPLFAQQKVVISVADEKNLTKEEASKQEKTNEALLYVYPASHPNGMAVICCPGGGYSHLAIDKEGRDMADWMNAQGITFAVLKYRMPKGDKTVPLSDAEKAMSIMKKHAAEWKFDAHKIGIMGSSAGGHLAASLANLAQEGLRPAFQVLFYPVITMQGPTHQGSRDNLMGKNPSEADLKRFSLEEQVTAQTPPAFITLSADDRAVPPTNTLNYVLALDRNHIPVSLHMYPVGGHGWGYRDNFTYKRQWTGELEKWFRELLPTLK